MPTDTFFNLSEEKRNKILNVAIDEFAEYFYHNASVSRIVKEANIAKGSFYQYFSDKKDLFKYIMDISAQKKLKYLTKSIDEQKEMDFFQRVREIYIMGLRFAKDHPKLQKIGINLVLSHDEGFKRDILGENIPKSDELFEKLLKQGIESGDINPDIDLKVVAHMITTMSISISEYFLMKMGDKDIMDIMNLVDNMLDVFKNGIKNGRK